MPVVINEFEVVPAPTEQGASQEGGERPAASGPTPHDIQRVVEHAIERARRLRAH